MQALGDEVVPIIGTRKPRIYAIFFKNWGIFGAKKWGTFARPRWSV